MTYTTLIFVTLALVAASSAQWSVRNTKEVQQNPYPSRGWRPSGPVFGLPLRQQLPHLEYGPPATDYETPSKEYGPPLETTTVSDLSTTTEEDFSTTTTNSGLLKELENNGDETKNGQLQEGKDQGATQQGVYYIYHPNGLLQKILYATKDDVRNMAYTAQLKYQNVEPIRGPIFTYDPQTFAFRQIGA